MRTVWAERMLWIATAASLAVGVDGVRMRHLADTRTTGPTAIPAVRMREPTSDSLLDAVGVARELDLFRPDRSALDSAVLAISGVPTQPAPTVRPQLISRGLVGGPSPEVIIEGVPGVEGSAVFHVGETRAGITLRAVRRDTAIFVAKDTTWKLTVKRF